MFEELTAERVHPVRNRPRRFRRTTALLAAGALTAGMALTGGITRAAAAGPVSQGLGQFLGGAALGTNLDNIVSVTPATAVNNGGAALTQTNPLSVTALNAVNVNVGGGINLLGNNGILALGAANQYAQANPDGSSSAASGAVSNSGAVQVGGSGAFPANATLDLSGLIGAGLAGALTNAGVTVGAVTGTASQTAAGVQAGGYQIAGLSLNVTSPLVSGIVTNLRTSLIALQPTVNALPAQIRALPGVGPLATITGVPNLATITDALTTVTSADGSITANLQTGVVSIDVAKVLATAGLDLNNLDPNTQLLPYITAALTTQLLPALTSAVTGLDTTITNAINSISVSVLGVPVALAVLAPVLNPVITTLVAPVNTAAAGLGGTVVTPLATALSTLVSLQGNVQETAGGTFTERALRIGVLPTAPTPAAIVNLASATVGPNAGPLPAPTAQSLTPDNGPAAGGQNVTVTGTGFVAGSTSVTIGGNTVPVADVTVNSATSLTFATPAHAAGAVGVTVTTPSGTSAPALDYTYNPAVVVPDQPTATGLTPDNGPTTGGTNVTVTGTGFITGATSVTIGGVIVSAADVTVNSPTSLTFATPVHAAGAVGVTVTTAGGTSAPALDFTYTPPVIVPPAPTTLSLAPDNGPAAGGQNVTVTGTDFVDGATSVTIGGNTVTAANVTVNSPTSLTFTTPAHAAGGVGVTVTTAGGTSAPALTYTYNPAAPVPPTATALDPDTGPTAGGQTVTITGSGFITGLTGVSIAGIDVTPVVTSSTSLNFITPAHAAGLVGVTVTTINGTSNPNLGYTYVAPAAPTTSGLTPDSGPAVGGQTVTVTGTGFVTGLTSVTIDGIPVSADVTSPTSLTFVTPADVPGPVAVTVTTPNGTSAPALTYTYLAPPAPTTSGLTPDTGPTTGGQTVTVTGSGFVVGLTAVTIGGNTVSANATSATSLTFVTPAHPAGAVQVTVTTLNGTSSPALGYTYVEPVVTPVQPTATGLNPNTGPTAGGQTVTVTGTDFVDGQTTVTIGGNIIAQDDVTVTSPTTLTFVTPPHAAGAVGVTVSTAGGTSAPALTYTYVAPVIVPDAPTTTALNPDAGPTAGGQTVTVTGTGFINGATSVTIGGTTVPATVNSTTSLTFETPAHPAGGVDVTVTTAGGTSDPALTYTYVAPLPTTSGLNPDAGPTAGGQLVTVNGDNFVIGLTSVTIGGNTVPATVNSATSLTFVTPAHAAGPVGVVVNTPAGTSIPALDYTYLPPAPTAGVLDPDNGPTSGGQIVTVTGTGFTPGDTTVTIGGITVPATVETPTTLTFVTPPHAAGDVDVTVTTPGGTSTPGLPYTYNAPVIVPDAPAATALNPDNGPIAGGTTVTVTGTGFVPGDTSVSIGGITVAATVETPTTLTFVTPPHAAGGVPVTVTTAGGTSDPALTYTYNAPIVIPGAPTTTALDPDSGPTTGGQTVTITGTGFDNGLAFVTIGGIGQFATVTSDTSLTIVTPPHAAGPVDVTVQTAGGTSTPALTYTYVPPVVVPVVPTATALNPSSGPTTGGQTVTVTGTGFVPGVTIVTIGGNPALADVTSPTSLTFTTPAHAAGAVDVTVTTLGSTSDPALTYTYVPPVVLPVPSTTGLSPVVGPVSGGQTVTVTGTGFLPLATSVTIGGNTVSAANVVVNSATSLTFVTPPHAAGAVDVTVTTPGGTSDPALTYTYVPPVLPPAAPTSSLLDPDHGPITGGQTVTVTGTGFVEGATSVTIAGITVAATVDSPTSLTFTTPAHPAGAVDVTVTTAGGTSAALTYTYDAGTVVPTAGGLSPDTGPTTGGQTVTVTGAGFVPGATTVTIGGTEVPATVTSPTTLTFVTPAHAEGPVDVTVTTPGGTSTPALTYTYVPPVVIGPIILSLTPNRGPVAGGQTVLVRGSGFVAGRTSVTIGGIVIPATDVMAAISPAAAVTVTSPTTLTFLTPAHALGPVTVTVTTPSGTSGPLAYRYIPQTSVPTTTKLSPTSGPTAGGQTVTITGTGFVAGETTVTIAGTTVVATVTSPTTLTFTTPAHGAGPVEVTVTTPGGESAPALTYTYVSPTAVPDPPVITGPPDGGIVTDPNPPITGTGDPGNTIVVHEGTTTICTAMVGSGGLWSCSPTAPLTAGNHTLTATQTDGNGATSGPSHPISFTVAESAAVGVSSGSGSGTGLAYTGSDSAEVGLMALLMMVVGGLVILGTRRRQVRR